MNRYFSLNNIKFLFTKHFVENGIKDLYYILFTVLFFAVLSYLTNYCNDVLELYLVVAVVFFSSRFFTKVFNTQESSMHYLLLPASRIEKIMVEILSGLYYILLIFFMALLGIVIGNLFAKIPEPMLTFERYIYQLASLMLWQAIFMFGSIYFKKNPVIKTLVAMFAFNIFLGLIVGLIFSKVDIESITGILNYYVGVQEEVNIGDFAFKLSERLYPIVKIISILFSMFFWTLSYFRLKEKEV